MSDPASRPETDDANGSRTHRDPAIEAAQRAFEKHNKWLRALADQWEPTVSEVAAAREALKPVRELHRRRVLMCIGGECAAEECDHEDGCPEDVLIAVCAACWDIADECNGGYYGESGIDDSVRWPCATAKRAYTTEELNREQFDVGGPNRCYRCGRKDALHTTGEGGYVWKCCDCPHPAD